MRDDDDASAHALFSCPLFDGKKKIQTRRWRDVDATKTTTHLRGDGRKVPGIRGVLRQNGLGAIIARRGDERVYERHDTLRRAQKKMRTKRKAPPSLFFPTKAERNSIQIERIIRRESETNLKSTTLHESNKKKKNGGGGGRGGYAHGQTQKKKTQLVVVALLLSIDSTSGVPIEIDVPFASARSTTSLDACRRTGGPSDSIYRDRNNRPKRG